MRQDSLKALAEAQAAVRAQTDERDRDYAGSRPRYPWTVAADAMRYVLHLPPEYLAGVRLHCDIFLGVSTPTELFMHAAQPGPFDDYYGYSWLGEGIDPALWASEPPVPTLNGHPLGLAIGDRIVNQSVALHQRYLCNLLRLGLSDGQRVVEIGAGYGGLAESILRARNVSYVIVDLPETLIFSAAFLITHFPGKKIYVYRPGDGPEAAEGAELIFLPNYRANWIPPCDVAVNTVSFSEMSRTALQEYVDILANRLAPGGYLMSVNYHGNRPDGKGVTDFLAERFDLHPQPEEIMTRTGKSEAEYRDLNFRPTIICTRKGAVPPDATLRDVLSGERLEFALRETP